MYSEFGSIESVKDGSVSYIILRFRMVSLSSSSSMVPLSRTNFEVERFCSSYIGPRDFKNNNTKKPINQRRRET